MHPLGKGWAGIASEPSWLAVASFLLPGASASPLDLSVCLQMVLHAACRTVRRDDRSAGVPKTFCCFKHIIPKGKHRAQAPVIKYYIEHMYSAARRVPLCSNPSLQKTSEHTRMLQLACRTASFIHMKIKAQLWSGKILNTTNPVNQCKISRCTRRRKVLMRCKYPNFCVHVRTVKKALSKTCH